MLSQRVRERRTGESSIRYYIVSVVPLEPPNVPPPFRFRQRPQLADEVVQYVRSLIMFGAVEQGTFLRLEPLAKKLGISATPVREAMAALEREGLVRLEPRRGYVVTPLSRQDVEDLYMVEAFIQGELVARAAKDATAERVAELRAIFLEMSRLMAAGQYDEADESFFRFYELLHDTAGSPRLSWLAGKFSLTPRTGTHRIPSSGPPSSRAIHQSSRP